MYKFSKNTQTQSLIKIRPVGGELFHTGGQTDRQTDRLDKGNIFSQLRERAYKP